jgi:hypothetical protein
MDAVTNRSEITRTPTGDIVVVPDTSGRPDPKWVRGRCPECGDDLVSNLYYVSGQYVLAWECWSSLASDARCTYRRIL